MENRILGNTGAKFGAQLKAYRRRHGVSQIEIARRVGFSRQKIARMEKGWSLTLPNLDLYLRSLNSTLIVDFREL